MYYILLYLSSGKCFCFFSFNQFACLINDGVLFVEAADDYPIFKVYNVKDFIFSMEFKLFFELIEGCK